MKFLKNGGLAVILAAVLVAADQYTKWLVVSRLPLYQTWAPFPALADYVLITHNTNTGAAFGLFKDWNLVFICIAIVVIAAIIFYQRQLPDGQWLVRIALGFQLGGAAGNLVDRLRVGQVTDFLLVQAPIGGRVYQWPAFNVADSSIVTGVILLALIMARESRTQPQAAPVLEKQVSD
jgi:signal peptidase II